MFKLNEEVESKKHIFAFIGKWFLTMQGKFTVVDFKVYELKIESKFFNRMVAGS